MSSTTSTTQPVLRARGLLKTFGRGVALARPPVLEPWGLVEAWVDDPDGVRIHVVEVPADHPLRRDTRAVADDPQ